MRAHPIRRREATDPQAVLEIIEAHAVAAADRDPRLFRYGAEARGQFRFAVIFQIAAGEDRRGAHTVLDRVSERRFEPDIGDAIRGDAEELRNGDRFGARLRGEADGERSAAG